VAVATRESFNIGSLRVAAAGSAEGIAGGDSTQGHPKVPQMRLPRPTLQLSLAAEPEVMRRTILTTAQWLPLCLTVSAGRIA
jgi:hypothetical protein